MSVALNKKQVESNIGIELVCLLNNITSDGQLDEIEIKELKEWIDQNKNEFRSIEYLSGLLDKVLEDGKLSEDEIEMLQVSIEKVLPLEHRQIAKLRRKEHKKKVKEELDALHLLSIDAMVQGTWVDNRPYLIDRYVEIGTELLLIPEPTNKYDPNAVKVCLLNGKQIGYLPRDDAFEAAPILTKGCNFQCIVSKILGREEKPIPVVVANLYDYKFKESWTMDSKKIIDGAEHLKPSSANQTPISTIVYGLMIFVAIILILKFISSF